ncbi:Nif3-like dinuclear metal center hexameric protein, partial [Modestobacter sp. KNN46-3]|uniref:Nif3-like dinuclear metal center hexameric protein n=1 Tax=Modestobacter sp. KNN46-3 TaxID=2711218 RepID=UPI0013DEA5E4
MSGPAAEQSGSGRSLGAVIAALEARYDPSLAEPWDAVGLVCGDPAEGVRSVLFAVDPTSAVVDEAIAAGADLLVTHHPLLLTPVHGVPADDPKGRVVHRLVRAGIGLFVAHTNADRAAGHGVSDALAAAVGLVDAVPLEPAAAPGAASTAASSGRVRLRWASCARATSSAARASSFCWSKWSACTGP